MKVFLTTIVALGCFVAYLNHVDTDEEEEQFYYSTPDRYYNDDVNDNTIERSEEEVDPIFEKLRARKKLNDSIKYASQNEPSTPEPQTDNSNQGKVVTQEVIICNGSSAYAYHKYYCGGLSNCKGGIEKVSVEKALEEDRTPCGNCYR